MLRGQRLTRCMNNTSPSSLARSVSQGRNMPIDSDPQLQEGGFAAIDVVRSSLRLASAFICRQRPFLAETRHPKAFSLSHRPGPPSLFAPKLLPIRCCCASLVALEKERPTHQQSWQAQGLVRPVPEARVVALCGAIRPSGVKLPSMVRPTLRTLPTFAPRATAARSAGAAGSGFRAGPPRGALPTFHGFPVAAGRWCARR